jgi:hypothetical protein
VKTNGEGKPVVALDIDGTLGDYHTNFLTFADLYFYTNCGSWAEKRTQPNPGLPLWEWMGISHRDYRDAKLAYRQGGWKRWMPAYEGVAELTQDLRAAGAEVWLCTTRPYLRLDNVDPDTREWLSRNLIAYDAVLFDPLDESRTKYDELFRQAGSRVASIVDDLPEMIVAASRASAEVGGPVPVLRDQPYNQHFQWPRRVFVTDGIRTAVFGDLKRWREVNG